LDYAVRTMAWEDDGDDDHSDDDDGFAFSFVLGDASMSVGILRRCGLVHCIVLFVLEFSDDINGL